MYGLVNKGLEDLIRTNHGDAAWKKVCAASGFAGDTFSSMQPYPDSVTYGLVAAASQELGISGADLLEQFGAHWVRYTGSVGYGALFSLAGTSVAEVLSNLDALHGRIEHSFPDYRMPHFECARLEDGDLRLIYRSSRDGLAPMVLGLLRGLGERFGTPVAIRHTVVRGDGADHDEFVLRVATP